MKKKILGLLIATLSYYSCIAAPTLIDGIYYNLNTSDQTASVTYNNIYDESYYPMKMDYTRFVIIPSKVKHNNIEYTVTAIGDSAFYRNWEITNISIPGSVTSIGKYAFYGCSVIERIILPNNITEIKEGAFSGCNFLEEIHLPKNLNRIENKTFEGCYKLENITLPQELTTIGDSAFLGCYALKKITIPKNVTKIGKFAFFQCRGLKQVINESALKIKAKEENNGYVAYNTIGVEDRDGGKFKVTDDYLFFSNNTDTWLVTYYGKEPYIELPLDYEGKSYNIAPSAFRNNSNLIRIKLSPKTKQIGEYAFAACKFLEEIVLPDSLNEIAPYTFCDCYRLSQITMPNQLKKIGKKSFENTKIRNIKFPPSLSAIDSFAFYKCTYLTYISLPPQLSTIKYNAFDNCNKLSLINNQSQLNVQIGTEHNGKVAFYAKNIITSDETQFKEIGDYLFKINEDSTEINLIRYIGNDSIINLPQSFFERKYKIESNAFFANNTIREVNFSEGVTEIGHSAFYECENLAFISFSDSLKKIDKKAFSNCKKLHKLILPKNIEEIGDSAFLGCDHLFYIVNNSLLDIKLGEKTDGYVAYYAKTLNTEGNKIKYQDDFCFYVDGNNISAIAYLGNDSHVSFPNDFNGMSYTIERKLFYKNENILKVTIPQKVTIIGDSAFCECPNLREVIITADSLSISKRAFAHCSKLSNISLSEGVVEIGDYAFSGCSNLSEIKFPESVKVIGSDLFYGSSNLKDVTLPKEVHYFGSCIFYECSNITSCIIPEGCTELKETFYDGQRLIRLTLPNSLTTIGKYAICGCWNLTSLKIPDNVTEIGYAAMYGCTNLQELILPEKINFIGEEAFFNCQKVKKIVSLNPIPPTMNYLSSITNIDRDIPIYVPHYAIEDYKKANTWKEFTNYVGLYKIRTQCKNGEIKGEGSYPMNEIVTLTATPDKGYEFVCWSDGSTNNPRQITVSSDIDLEAIFDSTTTDINDISNINNIATITITDGNITTIGINDYTIYTLDGKNLGQTKHLDKGIFLLYSNGEIYKVVSR
jgi:hypothetical protein